jgi:hypothetical protein
VSGPLPFTLEETSYFAANFCRLSTMSHRATTAATCNWPFCASLSCAPDSIRSRLPQFHTYPVGDAGTPGGSLPAPFHFQRGPKAKDLPAVTAARETPSNPRETPWTLRSH